MAGFRVDLAGKGVKRRRMADKDGISELTCDHPGAPCRSMASIFPNQKTFFATIGLSIGRSGNAGWHHGFSGNPVTQGREDHDDPRSRSEPRRPRRPQPLGRMPGIMQGRNGGLRGPGACIRRRRQVAPPAQPVVGAGVKGKAQFLGCSSYADRRGMLWGSG